MKEGPHDKEGLLFRERVSKLVAVIPRYTGLLGSFWKHVFSMTGEKNKHIGTKSHREVRGPHRRSNTRKQ